MQAGISEKFLENIRFSKGKPKKIFWKNLRIFVKQSLAYAFFEEMFIAIPGEMCDITFGEIP